MHEPRWGGGGGGAGATERTSIGRFTLGGYVNTETTKSRMVSQGFGSGRLGMGQVYTMASYNAACIVTKFQRFCGLNNVPFPPMMEDSYIFAYFMCHVADSSARPESLLRATSAANWVFVSDAWSLTSTAISSTC